MSDCSNHKKDLFGESDMKHLAGLISELHCESLAILLKELSKNLKQDSRKDWANKRMQLSNRLKEASDHLKVAYTYINEAWQISKPFMGTPSTPKQQ